MTAKVADQSFRVGILVLGIAVAGLGCLTEITVDVPPGEAKHVAIRGRLQAGDTARVVVQINYLSDFVKFAVPESVSDATVFLFHENGQRLPIPSIGDGEYQLLIPEGDYTLEVKPGASYQLSVQLPDGKTYLSGIEPLYPVPKPGSLQYEIENRAIIDDAGNLADGAFLRFLINTPLFHPDFVERSYLRWDFTGTYQFTESAVNIPTPPLVKVCYITEGLNLENVVTYNGGENNGDVLHDFFLFEEPYDYRFAEGFYVTLLQESLSPAAYNYWENIGRVVSLSGTFFDAPPGKVLGNFKNIDDPSEEVYGFFYATQREMMRLFVPPADRRFARFCPASIEPEEEDALPTCFDCLLKAGSTLQQPEFWDP